MNRYQTIGPITTASIAAGASLEINIGAVLAGFSVPSSFNIVKVEVAPDTSSLFDVGVYKADTFAAAKLLALWDDHTGNLYYPINRSGGGQTEGLEGWPIPYDDDDGTGELHVKLTNGSAAAHTYAYTFTIEEVPVFTSAGNVAFRGNISQPASAYHNFGAVAGSAGYGVRDNAGTMEFKHSGGSWSAISLGDVTSVIGTANQVIVSAAIGDVTFSLPQSIAVSSTPTFAGAVMPAIGPASGQQHVLPAVASDTIALLAATQTLSNKSISGAANTLTNIGNAALTNSSLTVTAGAGLSGGGAVSLGGSVSLANAGVTSAIGTANQVVVSGATGAVTFSLPQSIAAGSSPTFAALTLTAPLTVPNGGIGVATLAANGVLYGNAAGVVLVTAQGPANSVLTANAGAPSFSATPTLTGLTLGTINISGTEPRHKFTETDAGADATLWDFDVQVGVFSLRTRTDVDGAGETAIAITRTTTDIVTQAFNASTGFGFSKTGAVPVHFVDIVAGTLAASQNALSIAATLASGSQKGANLIITGSGASGEQCALFSQLLAGYTGAGYTFGLFFENASAGTGATVTGLEANYGGRTGAIATTTGTNVGQYAYAFGGNINVGLSGRTIGSKSNATNISVLGLSLNAGSTPTNLAGYFGLQTGTPTFTSAALMADNGATTDPIFVCRDNGTPSFVVYDGGATVVNEGGLSTGLFRVESDTNVNFLSLNPATFGGAGSIGFGGDAITSAFMYVNPIAMTSGAGLTFSKLWIGNDSAVTIGTGTAASVSALRLGEPNITLNGNVVSDAYTLYIVDAPTEGTRNGALWVASGISRFGDMVGIGTSNANPVHYVDIVAGTLTSTQNALKITGTLSSADSMQRGAWLVFETAGATANGRTGVYTQLNSGYTGAGLTIGYQIENNVAGTGTSVMGGSGANYGIYVSAGATTAGNNLGAFLQASGGSVNVGVLGKAIVDKSNATNIGVFGLGLNTSGTPISVGGYFGLQAGTPTFTSAALMADNGATTDPIFVGRNNGVNTLVFNDANLLTLTDGDFALSVTGLAHGITDVFPTTAIAAWYGHSGTNGGAHIYGASVTAGQTPLNLFGIFGNTDPTDTSPAILLQGAKKGGGTSPTTLGSLETVLQIQNNTTPLVTVLGSGNVGIGTVTPSHKATVAGDGYILRLANASGAEGYNAGRDAGDGFLYFYGDESNYVGYVFTGVNGEQLRISGTGIKVPGNILAAGATAVGASGLGVFAIKNGTAPTTAPADTLQIFSADISAGNACLAWFQEAAVTAGIAVASTNKVPAIVNGQTLYLLATTIP